MTDRVDVGLLDGAFGQRKPAKKTTPSRNTTCTHCRKNNCGGRCWDKMDGKEKAKVKVVDKNGRNRTVTKNTGNVTRRGIVWCGSCDCRVVNGRCTNVRCSTRK